MKNNKQNVGFQLYNKYVRKYKRDYGVKGSTYSDDLHKIGKQLFGKSFIGVFSVNTVPKKVKSGSYFIFNTEPIEKKGEHWVACYKQGKYYIYDSFARDSSKLLPQFVKQVKGKYIDSDRLDREQTVTQKNCGLRNLGFLSVVRDLGIKEALKI